MSCTTKSLYQSIEACPGKKVLPGIRRRLYYIDKSSIANFPALPSIGDTSISDMAKLARLVGDFILKSDAYWQFIDLKDESSNVTYETAGENGSKLFSNQATAIVAGQDDDVKGFARQAINDDLVFVYQDRSGKFCVLGNEFFQCHTSPAGDTAAEATGASTSTFAIQVYDECPVPTYRGKLYISSTTYIDCATGQETVPANPEPGGEG